MSFALPVAELVSLDLVLGEHAPKRPAADKPRPATAVLFKNDLREYFSVFPFPFSSPHNGPIRLALSVLHGAGKGGKTLKGPKMGGRVLRQKGPDENEAQGRTTGGLIQQLPGLGNQGFLLEHIFRGGVSGEDTGRKREAIAGTALIIGDAPEVAIHAAYI